MRKFIKRYKFFILFAIINGVVFVFEPAIGHRSLEITWNNTLEMLSIIPPVFILLGLLDVWVERDLMIKFMGKDSGLWGIIIAFVLGSAAAGPLYAAFPIAVVLLKKGSSFSNVLIFIGAWSTTKIPMLLFEMSAMGWKFMLTRFIINIFGIIIIAYITEKFLSDPEKKELYNKAMSEIE